MSGIIYKISSPNTPLVYIGATGKELKTRWACHKSTRNFTRSNIVIGYGDATIEALHNFDGKYTHEELVAKEREYLELYKDNLVNIQGVNKGYSELKKEEISKKQYEEEPIVNCECCCVKMKRRNLNNHNKTKKHIEKERNILNLPLDFPLDYRTVKVGNCTIV